MHTHARAHAHTYICTLGVFLRDTVNSLKNKICFWENIPYKIYSY